LIAGPTVFICDECVEVCNDIIADDNRFENRGVRASLPTPPEIKKFLDEYVIGQELTKRKLAVAEVLRAPQAPAELHTLEPRRVDEPATRDGRTRPGASGLPADSVVSRRILPSGEVERRLANGVIERISSGKIVRIMPDGTQQMLLMQQVIPAAPPPPPPGSPEDEWLGGHAQQLLDMIVALAVRDPAARENYLATEADARNVYERIARRTQTIGYLTQP